jgi:hypothetical protein
LPGARPRGECAAVGGMNDEQRDFADKLELIETEANRAAEVLPPSILRDRLLHIAVVAHLLQARLQLAAGVILPASEHGERRKR